MEMSLGFVHINDDGSIGTDGDATVHTSTDTTDGTTTNVVTSTTDTTSITPTTDGGNVAGADDEEGSSTLDFTTRTEPFRKRSIPVSDYLQSSRGKFLWPIFSTF